MTAIKTKCNVSTCKNPRVKNDVLCEECMWNAHGLDERGQGASRTTQGVVAQLGERFLCKEEVAGARPADSIPRGRSSNSESVSMASRRLGVQVPSAPFHGERPGSEEADLNSAGPFGVFRVQLPGSPKHEQGLVAQSARALPRHGRGPRCDPERAHFGSLAHRE